MQLLYTEWINNKVLLYGTESYIQYPVIKHNGKIYKKNAYICITESLNMPANLEKSAVATGLEKVSFHSNPKERQCQRMLKLPHNCTHLTC